MSDAFKDFSEQHHRQDHSGPVGSEPGSRGTTPPRLAQRWYPLIGAVIGFLFILLVVTSAGSDANARMTIPHEEWITAELQMQETAASKTRSVQLHRGDHAVAALQRLGFDAADSHRLVDAAKSKYDLKRVRVGQIFKRVDSSNGIDFYYDIDADQRLHVHRANDDKQWQASIDKRKIYARQRIASGTIQASLFAAAEAAGMDQRTTMNLVDIFAWDIDFARDMRSGDSFKVVYEERFDDTGKMLGSTIQAARFVNQGKQFEAVRYEQLDGQAHYFTPDGKSMRKAYLKAPVKFSRISSRFSTGRKHPILGYTRAHRGVDYAAPMGTPVHAIGDGYIAFKGWKHGFGRFILIQHNNRQHQTAYAHMSRYGRGIHTRKRVRQGDIIGYVGMSGLATGPHLHFEFRSRGRAVNPLTVKHPPANPVAKAERDRFMQQTAPLLGQLQKPASALLWG